MAKRIEEGQVAPDFTLPSHTGGTVKLSDYTDKNVVVLYFYPKDFTTGCTTEACTFRDNFQEFQDAGAIVIGVSSDSLESHKKFADEYKLPFTLLSDEGGIVREQYGAAKLGGFPARITFVIDKKRVVRMVFESMLNAKEHIEQAKNIVKLLTQ